MPALDRGSRFRAPGLIQPSPVRRAVGRVFQYAQNADHHTVIKRDVPVIAFCVRIALRKATARQFGSQQMVESRAGTPSAMPTAGNRISPGQIIDLRMPIAVVERGVVRVMGCQDRRLLFRSALPACRSPSASRRSRAETAECSPRFPALAKDRRPPDSPWRESRDCHRGYAANDARRCRSPGRWAATLARAMLPRR